MIYQAKGPAEIYRRVELDARVEGSDGVGLTRLCLEEAIGELERAELAHARGNRFARNDALSRASARIAALHQGVRDDNPLAAPLRHLYGAADTAVKAGILQYRSDTMTRVLLDLKDIKALLP